MRPGNCWVVAGVAVLAETPWTQEAADVLSIADSFQQQGEWQGAIVQYQRALQLSPVPPAFQRYVIHNNIGWSSYNLGHWPDAEVHYLLALQAAPQQPPTDHAYINLGTLYKAQRRTKMTIKAYRAAVVLSQQLPTWAQLGYALSQDFRVDEAVSVLQEGLAVRGESAAAAQECHHYLGQLHVSRRMWKQASEHFVRAIDLGLPTDATGCQKKRWSVVEGWASDSSVTVRTAAPP